MTPLFIPASQNSIFCVFHPPIGQPINRAILHIPAFGEEMNKSRRMVALQAKVFAELGYAVLVMDFFGCGESRGEFGDASLDTWLENIRQVIDWLKQQGANSIDLWGLRTGCLLALHFASQERNSIRNIICWQPVLNGDVFITQFLRLRIAAAIMDASAPREKTSDLKQLLQNGDSIEVAGYMLNPELINPLMSLRAERINLEAIGEIALFEVTPNLETQLSAGNSQLLTAIRNKGILASLTKVVGDLFWSTQEISEAPELIALSREQLLKWL